MSNVIETTVGRLFGVLEKEGIRYAVLRNYEAFPSLSRAGDSSRHTDIDLAVHSDDLPEFRRIMTGIAAADGWDALTECDHWSRSPVRHHNIEVFRFCHLQPLEYLQVDVFHGFLIWGFPLLDEKDLLDGRIYDENRGLTRMDPLKENIIRLFQIDGLYPGSPRKVARYRGRVVAFRALDPERFDRGVLGMLPHCTVRAAHALDRADMDGFVREIRRARILFALKSALNHPLRAHRYLLYRFKEHLQRNLTRQCGCVIKVYAESESKREMLRSAMAQLVAKSFMEHWKEYAACVRRTWNDHVIMEQGAVIIEWADAGCADLDLSEYSDETALAAAILSFRVARHASLYQRSANFTALAARHEVAQ